MFDKAPGLVKHKPLSASVTWAMFEDFTLTDYTIGVIFVLGVLIFALAVSFSRSFAASMVFLSSFLTLSVLLKARYEILKRQFDF